MRNVIGRDLSCLVEYVCRQEELIVCAATSGTFLHGWRMSSRCNLPREYYIELPHSGADLADVAIQIGFDGRLLGDGDIES